MRKHGLLERNRIERIYGILSNYGASPGLALSWLLALTSVHFFLNQIAICAASNIVCTHSLNLGNFAEQAASSIRVVTLQRFLGGGEYGYTWHVLLDSIVAGLAPIQIALVVLAIRARIRR